MSIKKVIILDDGSEVNLLESQVDNAKAIVIFAHGAGANMTHEFMNDMTQLLNDRGINVLRFNFPFMDKRALTGKKHPPDRMPKLLACYKRVIESTIDSFEENKSELGSLPLFIGGKSMGSRVAATLLVEEGELSLKASNKLSGAFCLGYPFHPAKKPEKLRLEPLCEATKPILIVQGERDTLGNQEEVASYHLPEHCHCTFLEDGDHSLKPRVKSGFTYQGHMKTAADEILSFIEKFK